MNLDSEFCALTICFSSKSLASWGAVYLIRSGCGCRPDDWPWQCHRVMGLSFHTLGNGKELVAKESITNYPKVIPSPLTLVLSKKKEEKRSIISTLIEH